jgi:glycerol kinase
MAADRFVLAIDQGTSSTKAVLVTAAGGVAASGSAPVGQAFPAPGWVEQDPDEIWTSVQSAVAACLRPDRAPARPDVLGREDVVAAGRARPGPLPGPGR